MMVDMLDPEMRRRSENIKGPEQMFCLRLLKDKADKLLPDSSVT
jgi:hypothetical protein